MCQTCVNNGWISQDVYNRIETFLDEHPAAGTGPAHAVLEDSNVADHNLRRALGWIRAILSGDESHLYDEEDGVGLAQVQTWWPYLEENELRVTETFLEELLRIPVEERIPNPEGGATVLDEPEGILGFPVRLSENMPEGMIELGDFAIWVDQNKGG